MGNFKIRRYGIERRSGILAFFDCFVTQRAPCPLYRGFLSNIALFVLCDAFDAGLGFTTFIIRTLEQTIIPALANGHAIDFYQVAWCLSCSTNILPCCPSAIEIDCPS